MCMEIKYLYIIEFFRFEFSVECIHKPCCLNAVSVSQWKVKHFDEGEFSSCVGKDTLSDISNTLYNVVIRLGCRGKRTTRIISNLDFTVGSLFHFFTPRFHYFTVVMRCRKEIGEVELYLFLHL